MAPQASPGAVLDQLCVNTIRTLSIDAIQAADSGHPGNPMAMASVVEGVPANVLTTALYERFRSRGEADFADRLLSAMRKQFGGHVERPVGG